MVAREHTWVPSVSNLSFFFFFLWPIQLQHPWKSPPSLASTSKVFSQPPGSGTSHPNHQQESPSERGGRGHGPQHAGKPCWGLLLHFLPRGPQERPRRPPAPALSSSPRIRLPLFPLGGWGQAWHAPVSLSGRPVEAPGAAPGAGFTGPENANGRSKWSGTPPL